MADTTKKIIQLQDKAGNKLYPVIDSTDSIDNASIAESKLETSLQNKIDGAQVALKFDEKPTENSENVVKSGKLYAYNKTAKLFVSENKDTREVTVKLTLGGTSTDGSDADIVLSKTVSIDFTHKASDISDAKLEKGVFTWGSSNITPVTSADSGLTVTHDSTTGTTRVAPDSSHVIPSKTEENNWNSAYTWVTNVSGSDTDAVINKWNEIVSFLDGIDGTKDESGKVKYNLESILAKKLNIYTPGDVAWDTTPTSGSTKAVTSGGVYSAISALETGQVATNKANIKALQDLESSTVYFTEVTR